VGQVAQARKGPKPWAPWSRRAIAVAAAGVVIGAGGFAVSTAVTSTALAAPEGGARVAASTRGPNVSSACTLNVVLKVAGETQAEMERQTASWVIIYSHGWTAYVPGGNWTMDGSEGGVDIHGPAGQSDASIGAYPQLDTPWTFASLGKKVFPSVQDSHTICQTPVERSAAESSQATELTGSYLGEHVHVVVILSLYTPTTPDLYYGEIRDIYAPYSQWTAAEETTLMLVMARAIESPEDAYS
jgi:hypothetical protein